MGLGIYMDLDLGEEGEKTGYAMIVVREGARGASC